MKDLKCFLAENSREFREKIMCSLETHLQLHYKGVSRVKRLDGVVVNKDQVVEPRKRMRDSSNQFLMTTEEPDEDWIAKIQAKAEELNKKDPETLDWSKSSASATLWIVWCARILQGRPPIKPRGKKSKVV